MLLLTYGTRPEWIKIKPLIEIFKNKNINYKILFTGQHENIGIGEYHYALGIPNRNIERLNNIICSILSSNALEELNPKAVIVQGDTASVLSVALKFYNLRIPVIHLEAGLRTYDLDNPFPEEAYRQMVSRISWLHLCPTENNKINLELEKVNGIKYVVGNTVLDNLVKLVPSYQDKVLCTFHRRENHHIIKNWFEELQLLAFNNPNIEFILPIHPNPNVIKHKDLLKNVKVVEPLEHQELINILKDVKLVITDSGGIQEEACFLQKKIIVCRKISERNEKSNHIIICKEPNELKKLFNENISSFEINEKCPYGDGFASEKIFNILSETNLV
jgi:UDP-N-acetylglucosamine 2-epimerase (non-hydrolysing)